MTERTITISGSSREVLAARAALSLLSGVLYTDVMPDGHSIRLHQGKNLSEFAILGALERAGVSGASIQ